MFGSFRTVASRVGRMTSRTISSNSRQIGAAASVNMNALIAAAAVAATVTVTAVTVMEPVENAGFSAPAKKAPVDYDALRKAIVETIEKYDETHEGRLLAPTVLRLAWHTSGTYSQFGNTGGSGSGSAMRYSHEGGWEANNGLDIARNELAPLLKKFDVTVGDLWTLAGVVAIEHMGGPVVPWRAGRADVTEADAKNRQLPDGRLPNADMGCPYATNCHVRDVFGRMGFNDQETVALIGAHAVGFCHTDASGYSGPWTRSPDTFSNQLFVTLLNEKWVPKKWDGPFQFVNENGGDLMMLPADLYLLKDPIFKKWIEIYAADEERYFQDFSKAFSKLIELGVKFD